MLLNDVDSYVLIMKSIKHLFLKNKFDLHIFFQAQESKPSSLCPTAYGSSTLGSGLCRPAILSLECSLKGFYSLFLSNLVWENLSEQPVRTFL